MHILGTICMDRQHEPHRWFQVWGIADGQKMCDKADSVQELMDLGISSDQVVFAFQLPLRKGSLIDFTRWQQSLAGVLYLDIDHDERYELAQNATLALVARLGYKNRGNASEEWTLLAASEERRHLDCSLDPEYGSYYTCRPLLLFELGSLHHDYYLLNLRLPTAQQTGHNVNIGKLADVTLVIIFQNGGFTKLWVSLKMVFLPLVAALLVRFWRRVRTMPRAPTLLERLLLALGVSLSALNLPLEFLTLRFDMPFLPLVTAVLQGVFYAAFLSFCLVFVGEHRAAVAGGGRGRLAVYWRQILAVVAGCASLVAFDASEHGAPLANPFHRLWAGRAATDVGRGVVAAAGVAAGLYLCLLSWTVWRAVRGGGGQRQTPPGSGDLTRRVRCLLAATLSCAGVTVIGLVVTRVFEGLWKWNEEGSLEYVSVLITGVYGAWNMYTAAVLCLYAPTQK